MAFSSKSLKRDRAEGRDEDGAHPWLQEKVYAPKKRRTVELVERSVESLQEKGLIVSLSSIVAKSKEIDPEGRGVSLSAILNNGEARAYYKDRRTWKSRTLVKRVPKVGLQDVTVSLLRVKLNRNVARTRERYMKMNKRELVERLLRTEHAYAEQEERWLEANDELLALQLQVEKASLVGAGR